MLNLKELRKQKGLTQQQLADILEITRQSVFSIEKQIYSPKTYIAYRYSKFFNIPIHTLFLNQEDLTWQPKMTTSE